MHFQFFKQFDFVNSTLYLLAHLKFESFTQGELFLFFLCEGQHGGKGLVAGEFLIRVIQGLIQDLAESCSSTALFNHFGKRWL